MFSGDNHQLTSLTFYSSADFHEQIIRHKRLINLSINKAVRNALPLLGSSNIPVSLLSRKWWKKSGGLIWN